MTFDLRPTTDAYLSRLMSVTVCICAFTCLPLPQLAMQAQAGSAEAECPIEEDGEHAGEELVVSDSARRRLKQRRDRASRSLRPDCRGCQVVSYGCRPGLKAGHQLSNGLLAPLVV